jgi:preprotein translocase SecE subunit
MFKKINFFLKETQIEFKKVIWPTVQVLKRSTIAVIILVFLMAFYFGLADLIFSKLLKFFLR